MWSSKKADPMLAAKPELKDFQPNQAIISSPTILEGTTQKNKELARPTGAIAESPLARLGPGLHVKGEISACEDLLSDGLVEGSVHARQEGLPPRQRSVSPDPK